MRPRRTLGLLTVVLIATVGLPVCSGTALASTDRSAPIAVTSKNILEEPGTSPVEVVIAVFQDPQGMDVRLLQWTDEVDSERILSIESVGNAITLAPGLDGRCWMPRAQGLHQGHLDRSTVYCRVEAITKLQVEGGPNSDLVCVIEPAKEPVEATLDVHTVGDDDAITGGARSDELNGGAGRDLIRGGDGGDDLYGYEFPADDKRDPVAIDRDHIWGEGGIDHLWGGPGNDQLVGGEDFDVLCGADAQRIVTREGALHGDGCVDWAERDGSNSLFSSELKDFNLDTGFPAPLPADEDGVNCGGPMTHTTQYDVVFDEMENCPRPSSPSPTPPQYPLAYRTPLQAAVDQDMKACPPVREEKR